MARTPVQEFIHGPVHVVDASARLPEVLAWLDGLNVSGLAVVDAAGQPIGIVTRSDLLALSPVRAATGGARPPLILPAMSVREVMTLAPALR